MYKRRRKKTDCLPFSPAAHVVRLHQPDSNLLFINIQEGSGNTCYANNNALIAEQRGRTSEKNKTSASGTDKQTTRARHEAGVVLLPQCVSPFLLQVVCHLVHLLLLLSPDGHHSGLMLLPLGLDFLLKDRTRGLSCSCERFITDGKPFTLRELKTLFLFPSCHSFHPLSPPPGLNGSCSDCRVSSDVKTG